MAAILGCRTIITFSSILVLLLALLILMHKSPFTMPAKPKLNVQSFPRPPRLEKTPRHVQIKYHNHMLAETREAYWALETHHPPTYYIPRTAFSIPLLPSSHSSFCEWKGRATYWNIELPGTTTETVKNKAWSYENPTKDFEPVKGYISLYANAPWECYVDGEQVKPQEGDFYGGWMTADIEGKVKGGPGTLGW